MGWYADLRRRLVPQFPPKREDDLVRLLVTPLEQRRVLSISGVTLGAAQTVDEGTLVEVEGGYDSNAPNSPYYVSIDWDDGSTADPPKIQNSGKISGEHYYADDGEYEPVATVVDKEGNVGTSDPQNPTLITVQNVAPTLTVAGDQTADAGTTLTVEDIGTFTDPGYGPSETFEYSIDWGDGTPADEDLVPTIDTEGGPGILTAGSFDGSHVYATDGEYTVTVTIKDDDGGVDTKTLTVVVGNDAPTLTVVGDQDTTEGTEISFTPLGTFVDARAPNSGPPDPAGGDYTYEIDWGDGSPVETGDATIDVQNSDESQTVGSFDGSHIYAGDGVYTFTATIYDGQGGSDSQTFNVTVYNEDPSIDSLAVSTPINEGDTATLTGTYSDPGTEDTHELDIDWNGDGAYDQTVVVTGGLFSVDHLYLDDEPSGTTSDTFPIYVRLRDDDDGQVTDDVTITVNNVAPTIDIALSDTVIDENGFVTLTGTVSDTGTQDTHTLLVDWGDGSLPESVTVESDGSFTTTHQYLDDNPTNTVSDNYTITATVTDDDGLSGSDEATITVNNVAPAVDIALSDTVIDENGFVTLTGTVSDTGTEDTHELLVDWGDGSLTESVTVESDGSFAATHQYLDDNPTATVSDDYTITATVTDDDGQSGSDEATITVNNVAPAVDIALSDTVIDENGFVTLTGTVSDTGTQDTHTLLVDWGDGSLPESVTVESDGSFTATHQYLDDNPTATVSDDYTITATVTDDDGQSGSDQATVTVNNVAPAVDIALSDTVIDENGFVTLTGTVSDTGTQDTHTLLVDWGDGSLPESVTVESDGSFTATHQYLDDNPTATVSDDYTITATVTDDDGQSGSDQATITVNNVAPTVDIVLSDTVIDENGFVTLTGTVSDTGTQDTHTLLVDWGDGSLPESVTVESDGSFAATHQYLDDNPTATVSDDYTITATVTDDDGQSGSDQATITVNNVAPTVDIVLSDTVIDENGFVTLTGTVSDTGTEDTHELLVDWGDGSLPESVTVESDGSFTTTHQYLDDNPTATVSDDYTITATVTDDDGQSGSDQATITVNNVAPTVDIVLSDTVIDENGFVTLTGTVSDTGTEDTHELLVDWGDGSLPESVTVESDGSFTTTHQYLDDNPTATVSDDYTITATVTDDDGQSGSDQATITVNNVAPTVDIVLSDTVIDENGFVTLTGTVSDTGTQDTHTLLVDWGDGSLPESVTVESDGSFAATHQYLDDNPTATVSDDYTITATVTDDDGQSGSDEATVTVNNVAPAVDIALSDTVIDENGFVTLTGTVSDTGTQDTHALLVDWGDGSLPESVTVQPDGTFTSTHQYLDDNPTATVSDDYTITATVTDDDALSGSDQATVTVNNVAPAVDIVLSDTVIDENDSVTLTGTVTDTGTLDTLTLLVDWGDGSLPESVTVESDGSFAATHQYLDDNPTATVSDDYTITATVTDDDSLSGSEQATITVNNVAPVVSLSGDTEVDEGSVFSASGSFTDPGSDTWAGTVDYGDGSGVQPLTLNSDKSFNLSHTYADNGDYTITVVVSDDDLGSHNDTFAVTVNNVDPTLDAGADQTVDEGTFITLDPATFSDPGFDNAAGGTSEDFTATIDWGDGHTEPAADITLVEIPGSEGVLTSGTIDATHAYADDGVYTVTVTVQDDDGNEVSDTFTVTVSNVDPTLAVVDSKTVDEGATLTVDDIGVFTDPGFDNPGNPSGEIDERFTYAIDWGDGTTVDTGAVADFTTGSEGVLSYGSFDGSHIYADNGTYTVTVTVFDDDDGSDTESFVVTVNNVSPTLTVTNDQTIDEGAELVLADIGTFTDPGFDNPNNTTGETEETFTYAIDWGDGTGIDSGDATVDIPGGNNVLTEGSFDGSHIYADNGTYTVTVTVSDDDGGSDAKTFVITVVNNVNPDLTVVADQTVDEGTELVLTDIGTFTDPGFDNPDNPNGEVEEVFTYTIDWGDGTSIDAGDATVDVLGEDNVPTQGSFDGSHTYADNGTYTVTVTVFDDDGGSDTETFTVTVNNVLPTISGVTGNETVDEGAAFNLAELGWAIQDPGFDNPSNTTGEVEETFTGTYTVDWGDGTPVAAGAIVNRISGQPGVLTVAEFGELYHTYADNGVYTVLVTFGDDDSPPVTYTLQITVDNVAPTVSPAAGQTVDEGATLTVIDLATFTDPGFDNALRPGGPSVETFSYEIDWGDGTTPDTGDATVDLHGSAGIPTEGSFDGSHVYADNGVYTVTFTVTDDDGGTTVATTSVTVLNVDPTVIVFDDDEVDTMGTVNVEGTFSDPGFDNPLNPLSPPDGSYESFEVVIDWGDGTTDTILMDDEGSFTATHTYDGHPNPAHPADDIRIVMTVTDDDGGTEVGETYAEVPGEGVEYVYIDTTPMVPQLVFPRAVKINADDLGNNGSAFFLGSAEYESARPDSTAASENYIVLRKVLPGGNESIDYRMPDNALKVLPEILRRLPDDRYRVYEIQSDGPERLVRDVFVRQQRVIDQTDASEGMEERAPQNADPRAGDGRPTSGKQFKPFPQ